MTHPTMSKAMRKHWSDPEWKARQRVRISQGIQRSLRCRNEPEPEAEKHEPWKPGDPKPEWLRRGT